jgi:hypothetical protein
MRMPIMQPEITTPESWLYNHKMIASSRLQATSRVFLSSKKKPSLNPRAKQRVGGRLFCLIQKNEQATKMATDQHVYGRRI